MSDKKHVVVIVLGDIGRSPRMNYHALSLLEHGHRVSLVGYEGEKIMPQLKLHVGSLNEIRFTPYKPPAFLRKTLLPVYYIFRAIGLMYGLSVALQSLEEPVDCILIQNPPNIPILILSYIFCYIQEKRINIKPGVVIDWHNLGFTMFAKPTSLVASLAKEHERTMAPLADGNLCVTKGMQNFLIDKFDIEKDKINVLYDRPPDFFLPTKVEVMHDLMKRLKPDIERQCPFLTVKEQNRTLFTEVSLKDGQRKIVQRKDRPALIVSSTSWTPDEDFSILLNSLQQMDESIQKENLNFPRVIVIVTGKGPQKQMYEKKIANLHLSYVFVLTMWLESVDYPKLLGCADLGISLHLSTSGLDLPMKVLDMFGCEVPVCAAKFECIGELVRDGLNGRVFSNKEELTGQLLTLLGTKERDNNGKMKGDLAAFRDNIRGMTRWRENWESQAYDMIMSVCPNASQDFSKKDD